MKFTVIILTYNSELKKILLTINSIIHQTLKELEIVIADDGSKETYNDEIKSYLEKNEFVNFSFTAPKNNGGTIRNILDGLTLCHGRYIKLIGAGDLLFEENTLERIYEYMQNQSSKICFGLMQGYYLGQEGQIYQEAFRAPKDIDIYRKKKTERRHNQLKKNVLIYFDFLSGASMFYEKNILETYLLQIKDYVKYCEDVITAKALLDQVDINFYDDTVTWYEVGEGISTQLENKSFSKLIDTDYKNFYKYLVKHYNDSMVRRGKIMLEKDGKKQLLERMIREPGKIIFSLKTRYQAKLKKHKKKHRGFLDNEGV